MNIVDEIIQLSRRKDPRLDFAEYLSNEGYFHGKPVVQLDVICDFVEMPRDDFVTKYSELTGRHSADLTYDYLCVLNKCQTYTADCARLDKLRSALKDFTVI